jgi:hypothetical protein
MSEQLTQVLPALRAPLLEVCDVLGDALAAWVVPFVDHGRATCWELNEYLSPRQETVGSRLPRCANTTSSVA